MSFPQPAYPPTLYDGGGEKSATIRRTDSPADLSYRNGGRVDYLATGNQTGGATGGGFGLYRWTFGDGVSGPGPHFHKTISESFYILSGTVKIYDGNDWVDTHAGDFAYVPPGGIHGFRHEEEAPASMLLMFTPGAPRESYFEGLPKLAELNLTDEEKDAFYLAHDNYWL